MNMRVFFPFLILMTISSGVVGETWVDATQDEDIAYFLFADPPSIERYSLSGEYWLAPIGLSDTPTAFAVGPDVIFVAYGETIRRSSLDGGASVLFQVLSEEVLSLVLVDEYLYALMYRGIASVDANSGALVDEINDDTHWWNSMNGVSFSPKHRRLFGRSVDYGPSDLLYVELFSDGMIGDQHEDPYHGDYPDAQTTHLFPDEGRVVDNSGTVYNTSDLTYVATIGSHFDDVAFVNGAPVVLREDELTTYDNTFSEYSSFPLQAPATELVAYEDSIYAFSEGEGTTIGTEVIPASDLSIPDWGTLVPHDLPFQPDAVILGSDDVVYLLSRTYQRVFRWSVAEGDYLSTIELTFTPTYMALDDDGSRLYLGYRSTGQVTYFNLIGQLDETLLLTAQTELLGLAAPGEFVFTVDVIEYRGAHIVYSADGRKISEVERDRDQRDFFWNPATRRIYSAEIWNPYDIYWEEIGDNGSIGDEFKPPYYIDYEARLPIRVSSEGSTVVLGSGWVLWSDLLEESHDLGTEILDATWIDDSLFTLRDSGLYSEIQEWDQDFVLQNSILVAGEPVRIFGLESQLLILYLDRRGVPRFWLRDPDASPDIDSDGILDHLDNCPETANPNQLDTDLDGIGDACNGDIDQDGDEWADAIDTCPAMFNLDQTDTDGDGIGDLCNDGDDRDGDEWADALDNCPDVVNPGQEDQDGDGTGDACDTCPAVTDEGALFIAAAAHTEGLQGSSWRTDLTVRNVGSLAAEIYLRFLPGGDNSDAVCVLAGQLPAGQAARYEDVIASVLESDGGGGIAISSTGHLRATSRTYTTADSGTFGLGFPARSRSGALGRWRTATLLQLQQNTRYRTNVGFLNLASWATTAEVRYFRQDDSMLMEVEYELRPMESLQVNRPLRGLGQIENAFAEVRVVSGGPILTYATVIDNLTNDPTYVEPQ